MRITTLSATFLAGLSYLPATNAGTLNNMTGTAQIYDSGGNPIIVAPTPITGDFDESAGTVIIDPWIAFFEIPVMSEIELLPPGTHTRPDVGTVTVDPGQVGGFIQTHFAASTDFPAFIVWDVTTVGTASRYEPVDSDGDGIPGHAMTSGSFQGFTIVYELNVGGSIPDVDVDLNVPGGLTQECSETGGSSVSFNATATLKGGATLGSISWTIDGADAGTDGSITHFLSLGEHAVEVTATTTDGVTDTESTTVSIRDTLKPSLDIEFIDTSSGMAITEIDSPRVSHVEVRLKSEDVCDEDPVVAGVAKPVTAIIGGEVIRIQGNLQDVDMPTTAIEVTANVTDDSGNKEMDQAILKINN